VLPLLDTHQHLIYPRRLGYGWTGAYAALAGRAFTLEDYRAATRDGGVAGTIFMECAVDNDDHHTEAQMIAQIARQPGSGILGIIASIRPENAPGFDAWLDEGRELGVVGYRRILHQVPDEVSRAGVFRANVRKFGARDLPFDMCFLARQLPIALELARACDGTRLVLDHCGVPDIAGGGLDPWRAHVTALARMPNVVAKLSGVFAYCAPGAATLAAVRPYVEHVIDAFGPERCLWGSDWPVVLTTGADLPSWISATRALLARHSEADAAAMAYGTAERVYRVRLPAPGDVVRRGPGLAPLL
jgi:predicted TIM-barrel fold metal-dependent hydrolase